MKTTPALLCVVSLFSSVPFAQEGKTLERPGDGRQVCGLGQDFHAGRRARLMELVGEEVLVFRGLPDTRENTAFRQDKTFWYLTGIESPNVALVLDGKRQRALLFVPKRTPQLTMMEGWEGEKWDSEDEWISELTGIEEVHANEELLEVLEKLLKEHEKVGVSLYPTMVLGGSSDRSGPFYRQQSSDPLDGRPSREEALAKALAERFDVDPFDVGPTLIEMRLVKTPEEIAAMKRAGRAGALAMAEAMRSTSPGIGEWDLDALMSFVQIREGAAGLAYHAIVGAGGNSCVLHYSANANRIADGDVVLIDYGPEVDHYTTDITRTWPANGTFSERQAEIYEAVLAAQSAGIEAAKPGATMQAVDQAATEVFKERGLAHLRKHSTCHWIGMEVHDPGPRGARFEPGMAFTIEPGLYEDSTGIGVRIEDVVVITEDGCEVITDLVPKELAEVEEFVQGGGVLDWMAGRKD